MREATGSTWVLQIMIVFILLFAAYLALTINYSKSFKVKNETISIIERQQGFTEDAHRLVNSYLTSVGYNAMGSCDRNGEWYGISSLENLKAELAVPGEKYYYCVQKINGYREQSSSTRSYYKVRLFYKFDLPVIGPMFTFNVDGKSLEMDFTYDEQYLGGLS